MTNRAEALRYTAFLLTLIRRCKSWAEARLFCDRFERVMDNLPPVPQPLVWDGDYA